MTPVQIGNATLYLGDCRDILPVPADAIVTDPPYGTGVTEWDTSIDYPTVGAILAATTGNYAAFFYSNTRLAHLLAAIKTCGWETWVMVWHKPNAMGFERRFAPQWVPVVVAYRGNPPFWGKDLFACPIVPQNVGHPTPKPVAVTQWLVERSSLPGQIVLDPFMGSGTTGVACANAGRRFVGIEREPRYFEVACERIRMAQAQGSLFDPPEARGEQCAHEQVCSDGMCLLCGEGAPEARDAGTSSADGALTTTGER